MRIRSGLVAGWVVVALLGGCEPYHEMDAKLDQRASEAEANLREATKPKQAVVMHNVVIDEGLFLSNRRVASFNGDRLPSDMPRGGLVSIHTGKKTMDLTEIGAEITKQTGLRVSIEDLGGKGGMGPQRNAGIDMVMSMNLDDKPIGEVFDLIGSKKKLDWEYDSSVRTVRLFALQTKRYDLAGIPGQIKGHIKMGTEGHGGGQQPSLNGNQQSAASTGSQGLASMIQSAEIITDLKPLESVEKQIKAVVGDNGKVVVDGMAAVVTGPKYLQRRVEEVVNEANEWAMTEVNLNVRVYKVTLSSSFNLGVNISLAFQNAAGAIASAGSGPALPAVTGAASASSTILPTNSNGKPSLWANSTAVAQALQTLGKVELTNEGGIVIANGRFGVYGGQSADDYLYSISTEAVANAGSQQALVPNTLETGFSFIAQPLIHKDGRIEINFGSSLSDAAPFTTAGSAGNEIQQAHVKSDNVMQYSIINSGDYLVIAGFDRKNNSTSNSTTPGGVPILGGSAASSGERDITIAVIQPVIVSTRAGHGF